MVAFGPRTPGKGPRHPLRLFVPLSDERALDERTWLRGYPSTPPPADAGCTRFYDPEGEYDQTDTDSRAGNCRSLSTDSKCPRTQGFGKDNFASRGQ